MVNISARNQDELSRILDSCLDQISSGSETVDSVLEQYPIYKDQLKPALEAAQWLQNRKEVFNPRPGFVQLSHRRLVNRFKSSSAGVETATGDTKNWLLGLFQERRLVVQYLALLTLTAVLLLVGYRSTVFLIQRSIPGDPLYDTKLAQEELSISLSSSEEQQTRLRIEFAQRRVVEMQELVLSGREIYLEETFANFKYQMDEAAAVISTMSETDPNGANELSDVFAQTLSVPVRNLVGILDATPEFASAVFRDSLNMLAAEIFGQPFNEPVLLLATPSPTSTHTATIMATSTPTQIFTATFTATNIPPTEFTVTVATPTSVPPTNTPRPPASDPTPTNTAQPKSDPTPEPIIEPTSAPPPTVAPTEIQPPPPPPATTEPPPPDKTKKPKPTHHPTYQPSNPSGK